MTRFKYAYVLNVMSDDHPGIISAVSGVVTRAGKKHLKSNTAAQLRGGDRPVWYDRRLAPEGRDACPTKAPVTGITTFSIFDLRFSMGSADFSHGVEGSATWESLPGGGLLPRRERWELKMLEGFLAAGAGRRGSRIGNRELKIEN